MSRSEARFATYEDKDWVQSRDTLVTDEMFQYKLKQKEIVVGELDGKKVGYLRLEYWYLVMPFMGLVVVEEGCRNKGIGRAMLGFLEEHLVKSGYSVLYSSSDVNEPEPQAWHRHMGFKDCGIISGMNKDGIGEVVFRKDLG